MSSTVVLTYGRSLMAVVAARSLKQRGVTVIGVDCVDCTALQFSKYCDDYHVSPDYDDAPGDYAAFLTDIAKNARRDGDAPVVIMPMFRDAKILAGAEADFPNGVRLAAPSIDSIDLIHPKDAFSRFADDADLAYPSTAIIDSEEALDSALNEVSAPIVVKPTDGVGGRGISFCDDLDDAREKARALLENGDIVLLQEPVPGDDYCVTILADNGELKVISAYTNLSTFPKDGGAGAIRKTVDHAPFEEAAQRFVEASNWSGIGEIDFRWDGETGTTPQIIEVNPRYWAGLFHSMASGVDFPWLAYRQAIGERIEFNQDDVEIGYVTKTPILWAASTLSEIAEEGIDTDRLQDALGELRDEMKRGKVASAVKSLSKGLGEAFSFDDAMFKLFSTMDDAEHAPSELSETDDPFVRLGALFVASSLIRHKKLPDEVKF